MSECSCTAANGLGAELRTAGQGPPVLQQLAGERESGGQDRRKKLGKWGFMGVRVSGDRVVPLMLFCFFCFFVDYNVDNTWYSPGVPNIHTHLCGTIKKRHLSLFKSLKHVTKHPLFL